MVLDAAEDIVQVNSETMAVELGALSMTVMASSSVSSAASAPAKSRYFLQIITGSIAHSTAL